MHESSGRRDNNIRVEQQPLKLILHIISSCDQHQCKVCILGNISKIARCLHCDFSCWAQDHCSSTDDLGVALKFVHKGDHESAGFTGACTSHSDHVEALEDGRDCFSLDWSWKVVTFVFDGLQDGD